MTDQEAPLTDKQAREAAIKALVALLKNANPQTQFDAAATLLKELH